ncbi:hypothetical protein ACIQU6_08735 [Streptomyces sp. NPDC090442]|uniref:hypothetical protein n=1 Tax=Streptomyces sp. NPDC090442 TaxID=3365962 RepID=UPI00382F22A6
MSGTHPRLLPWPGPDGQPSYLVTDDTNSYLSLLADEMEEVQLSAADAVLRHATDMLGDEDASSYELRCAGRRLSEALRDTLRIAESRGARLTCGPGGTNAASGTRRRLLPWPGPGGQPSYLVSDDGNSHVSLLADQMEEAQLSTAETVLRLAVELLGEARVSVCELRCAGHRLCESLRDALRASESRGGRLSGGVGADSDAEADVDGDGKSRRSAVCRDGRPGGEAPS